MSDAKERRKRRRWGDAPATTPTSASTSLSAPTKTIAGSGDAKAKAAALQQSISARLAALKAKKAQAQAQALGQANGAATSIAVQPPPVIPIAATSKRAVSSERMGEPPNKKAKMYDLDMSITAPTFRKPRDQPPKKKINPYLAHMEPAAAATDATTLQNGDKALGAKSLQRQQSSKSASVSVEAETEILLDNRLAGGHKKRRTKEIKFVEPGTYIHRAERKRAKVENATKSGFVSGRKQGQFIKSAGIADITKEASASSDGNYYGRNPSTEASVLQDVSTLAKSVPRADVVAESIDGSSKSTGGVVVIPQPLVMEWWDIELLPSKLKKEVVAMEGKAVTQKASQRMKLLQKGDDQNGEGQAMKETAEENKHLQERQELMQRCFKEASIQNSKTWKLVQHPVPVIPPNAPKEAKAPTLHLTKKEMKRQRKLRRAEKQRELQDMQAAGLIPAPEPKLTLSNFMRVLGDQAVLDPSKMEAKVMEQIQARRLKHERMNAERKLTKEQKAEKRDRKLTEDTSAAVSVALFLVKDMSHRYHRTKVDLNAQQNKITGGVLECEVPKLSLVICEGGPKAIKRYIRLMTVRMKWKGEGVLDIEESDDEEMEGNGEDWTEEKRKPQKVSLHDFTYSICFFSKIEDRRSSSYTLFYLQFNPDNSCELVWTGMEPKRMFRSFLFQSCETSEDARKVLEAKGVAHFWDQVLVHSSGAGETFNFKLGDA